MPHEAPGYFTRNAKKLGVDLEIVKLWQRYELPDIKNIDGLIMLGGSMGVYDEFPSKNDEINFIKNAAGKKPMLGICLGSQLIAHALGAKVYKNIRAGKHIKEIGYYDIDLTEAGAKDPLFKNFPSPFKVLHWHGDAFDLPVGAVLLAASPNCANQAFRLGKNIYATLFHSEFTPQMVKQGIKEDNAWIHQNFELDEDKFIKEANACNSLMEQQNFKLLSNFLSVF